jgi:hypothetical protein
VAVDRGEILRLLKEEKVDASVSSSGCSEERNTPAIYLLVASGALFVLGVAVLILLLVRRTRESQTKEKEAPADELPEPPQQKDHFFLVGVSGAYANEKVPIDEEGIVVGRNPAVCNLVLPPESQGVSRKHLEVKASDGGVQVRDAFSKLGTSIDGRRLPQGEWQKVSPGQKIELADGDVVFAVNVRR